MPCRIFVPLDEGTEGKVLKNYDDAKEGKFEIWAIVRYIGNRHATHIQGGGRYIMEMGFKRRRRQTAGI